MCKSLCSLVCLIVFLGLAISVPITSNIQKKQRGDQGTWNLTTNELHNIEERDERKFSRYHIFEPQLFTRLMSKLLTRTHNWKEHMKNVVNKFVSNYFVPNNSSLSQTVLKAGKEVTHSSRETTKPSKKNHKRNVIKSYSSEEETWKPVNFAPSVQFITASLDFSNKILLYQPQVIINGSVYIEERKDPSIIQLPALLNNCNRNNIPYLQH